MSPLKTGWRKQGEGVYTHRVKGVNRQGNDVLPTLPGVVGKDETDCLRRARGETTHWVLFMLHKPFAASS